MTRNGRMQVGNIRTGNFEIYGYYIPTRVFILCILDRASL